MNIVRVDYSMQFMSLDVYFSGCAANPYCKGCFNPEAWDFTCGKDWKQYIFHINDNMKKFSSMIKRVMIYGGEPLDQDPEQFIQFLDAIREYGKDIWVFTRHSIDVVSQEVKDRVDYIKCGPYIEELTTSDNCEFGVKLATSNQHIYKKVNGEFKTYKELLAV